MDAEIRKNIDPKHYQGKDLEAIDVIEAFDLTYHEGNIIKYVLRWRKKNGLEDLLKAKWYLDRMIQDEYKRISED
jgi:hypothetical protein